MNQMVLTEIDARGIARIALNRPELHNAIDDELIADLTEALKRVEHDARVRVVVLTGKGKSFCAGGDLNWMKRTAGYSMAENQRDALSLARMLHTLNFLAKPTLALVQGPAYGGGVGMVACCDIVIAATSVKFTLSEARLGLVPATISPYVVAAIGARASRRYFLSAEIFDAGEAHRLGLVHKVVDPSQLEAAGAAMIDRLFEGGPGAQALSKELIFRVADQPITDALEDYTARKIAEARASAEGREGIAAFLEKRLPSWRSK
ncbi:MAG: enoyl-CoA hydratase/isomerase family protein [Alphaproteobacteria bacterium]